MLHRLTLRVLPNLTLAVTEPDVRKRKRLVMLAPGLVAFVVYRAVKHFGSLSDPLVLLGLSGLLSAVTAVYAYRMGRQATFNTVWREDGPRTTAWIVGWIGFAYGVQLSLLVLALLRVAANYDFLLHPDGPGMMALIIACTSVARDAFEIGHIRQIEQARKPVLTFPDGSGLRGLIAQAPGTLVGWLTIGAVASGLGAWMLTANKGLEGWGGTELAQLAVVTLIAGSTALIGYLAGQKPGDWLARFRELGTIELLRFWAWPCVTFAATYYLVAIGIVVYVFRAPMGTAGMVLMAGAVGGVLTLYCHYLGQRRAVEDTIAQTVPSTLLRCPFVMGILSKRPGSGKAADDVAKSTRVPGEHDPAPEVIWPQMGREG